MDGSLAGGMASTLISWAIAIFLIVCEWKVYVKAGKPGWAAIIPIYNWIIMFEMAGKPAWWVIWMFIPIANLIVVIITMLEIGRRFGKSTVWSVFLLLIFSIVGWIILAFDNSVYSSDDAAAPINPPTPAVPATDPPAPDLPPAEDLAAEAMPPVQPAPPTDNPPASPTDNPPAAPAQ